MKNHRIIILKSRKTKKYGYAVCYGKHAHVFTQMLSKSRTNMVKNMVECYLFKGILFIRKYDRFMTPNIVRESVLAEHPEYIIMAKYKNIKDMHLQNSELFI
jgi:hypothetical protein